MSHRLVLEGLTVRSGPVVLVNDLSLEVGAGELVAVVGESGAGKSLTGRALVGMVTAQPGVVAGTVTWRGPGGSDVVVPAHPPSDRHAGLARLRGHGVAWIPQDARAALVPVHTVGRQLADALRHAGRPAALPACRAALSEVGFVDPDAVLPQHPHTLSGGMARRVQVALGLALGARFLVADEPTTGLDRPVQARLLQTLARLRDQGTGIVLITHDLHLVHRHADRVAVLHGGRVVADGPPDVLRTHPHPAVARLRGGPA